MNLVLLFIVLSIVNVIFSTYRTLVTINGGKTLAALVSGGYFAFYNIMLVYSVASFPMWQKCVITFVCNVIGVYAVKYFEEKARKDKLWKIEATFPSSAVFEVSRQSENNALQYNYWEAGKHTVFNFYCTTKAETDIVHGIIKNNYGKYFIAESKDF